MLTPSEAQIDEEVNQLLSSLLPPSSPTPSRLSALSSLQSAFLSPSHAAYFRQNFTQLASLLLPLLSHPPLRRHAPSLLSSLAYAQRPRFEAFACWFAHSVGSSSRGAWGGLLLLLKRLFRQLCEEGESGGLQAVLPELVGSVRRVVGGLEEAGSLGAVMSLLREMR